jgi:methionyl-tRNA formyltransferase
MWIDAGIDSGNILTTEFTPLNGDETFAQIHMKVMEHAHQLYVKAIKFVVEGKTNSIPQVSIANGITHYNKDWDLAKQFDLKANLHHLKQEFSSGNVQKKRESIKTISL